MSVFTSSPHRHAIAVAAVPSQAHTTRALALVVEDEATMRKLLRVALVSHGFRVVEAPSGAYFFKMTGPAHTVAAARAAFLQLLDSVRAG